MRNISLSKFFKNRFNILYIIIIAIVSVLAFRLAVLTIVEGEKYRNTADIKVIKDIPVDAPRGKIYDRNGIILADNLTSFTVQMYKNEIDVKDFNETIYTLTKILDENGEKLIDDFPIVLDTFEFITDDPENTQTPTEMVIDILKSNYLLSNWMEYSVHLYGETVSAKERAYTVLSKEINDLPIELKDGQFTFIEDEEKLNSWLESNSDYKNLSAQGVVESLLMENNSYMSTLMGNSKIRNLTYSYLNNLGYTNNLKLVDYSFIQDAEYAKIKKSLSLQYEGITEETTAKDDFIYLVKYYTLDSFLNTVFGEDGSTVAPGKLLLDKLKDKYTDLPININQDGETLVYEYTDTQNVEKYTSMLQLDSNTDAYSLFKALALMEKSELDSIIVDDTVKYYSQLGLLAYENPSISISSWEYTPINTKQTWIKSKLDSNKKAESAKDIFLSLRETLELDPSISDYDARNIFVINERYSKENYMSYHPIDLCYTISDKTVAMISERTHELKGINIEIEPVRYYPGNNLASHIIGYLGKISQDYEIKQYVTDQGYSPDDIIGKTGIEEKFESYLNGVKGKKTVEANAHGNTIKSVSTQDPVPGNDVYLTIDARLQEKAEDILERGLKALQTGSTYESEWGNYKFDKKYPNATSGSLVALDPKTGEVLALVNYPDYNLNLFATGISTEDWNSLMNDSPDPLAPRPLYNIALLTAIQPGSTFKMVTSLAALEKGVNPNDQVYCSGVMTVGGRNFGCWIYNMRGGAHGYQNMYQAIRNSCNFYFYTSMLGENPATNQKHSIKLDFTDVTDMAKQFGLNDPTGIEIDIPKEFSGGVPDISEKKASQRLYLRLFLDSKAQYYVKDGYTMDSTEMSEAISNIVGWINEDEVLSRSEVYSRLEKLNFDPNKTYGNGVPLGDILKYTYINQSVWNAGDSLNISIGQGYNAYTPIQMANYVATIANGGYRHNVSVIQKVMSYDGETITYLPERNSTKLDISDDSYLDVLKIGMKMVADDGAAFRNFPVQVAAKTGTAQKDGINPDTGNGYDDFAWYVAFAPYDDPQIAIACTFFQGGSGVYPSAIVRDVIGEYLKLNGTIPSGEEETDNEEQTTQQ